MSDAPWGAGAGPAAPGPAILFTSYGGVRGGLEQMLLDVILGIEQPVVLLCPEGLLADAARAGGIPVLPRPARPLEARGGPATAARAAIALAAHAADVRGAVRALRPGVVVGWGMRSTLACAAALATLADPPPLLFEHADLLPAHAAAGAIRTAARRARRVVAASQAVADDLDPAGRLGDRVRVAHPGVDVTRFTASPPPPGPPVVLLLGAIVAWKRPDLALEAVALAAREVPGLRLVVAGHALGAGSARLLARLQARAGEPDLAGRVEFAGPLADPRPALAAASCLLHCSDREPFGLVVLEAMASARPVVAPAAGGPLEMLDASSGRLFAPGDAAGAARALVELTGDPAVLAAAGAAAHRRAEEHYDLAACRRRWTAAAAPLLTAAASPLDRAAAPPGAGLTLVTVTHDSADELERLLASVARHLPGAEVVVADAGSTDAVRDVARRWAGPVRVLELENVGYGRAANAGVAVARTAACVVLNPDVELVDASLAKLAAEAVRPGAAERLLAPLVLRPDGRRQDSAQGEPVSALAALTALVPPGALPPPLRGAAQPWRTDTPRAIGWAVGCCVGGATATLRRLGPFDERIFLYGEDLELGLRARDEGVPTWWWPAARIIHRQAHASERVYGGEPFALLARQRRAVVAERRGRRAAHLDDLLQLVTFTSRGALKAGLRRPATRERRQLAALRRARRERPRLGA